MVWLRAGARPARTLRLSHVTRDNRAIEEARIIKSRRDLSCGQLLPHHMLGSTDMAFGVGTPNAAAYVSGLAAMP